MVFFKPLEYCISKIAESLQTSTFSRQFEKHNIINCDVQANIITSNITVYNIKKCHGNSV